MQIITLALFLAVIGFILGAFCNIEDAPEDKPKDVSYSAENTPEDKSNNEYHKSTRTTVIVKWLGRAFTLSAVILGLYVGCEYGSLSCDNVVKYTYDDSSVTTVSKYFVKGDSVYAELKNGDIYKLETSSPVIDNTLSKKEAIVKVNNEYFSNCFMKRTVIRYYKTNWFYISKGTKSSVLYVDKDTYAELMDITPLDIP